MVWLVSAPGRATRLSGLPLPADQALEFGVTDAHGVWVVGADGVYLYANSVFTRVAALPPHHPTATSSGASAGSLAAA